MSNTKVLQRLMRETRLMIFSSVEIDNSSDFY